MPADFSIKSGDRLPSIQATLATGDTAVNLTGAAVSFIMRKDGAGTPKINAPAVLVNAASGVVRYDWLAIDTDSPGEYKAEWEVTWADGKRQTFPTLTYHSVAVLEDLDDD